MGSHLITALLFFASLYQIGFSDSRVLRPCFERYANHRLVNVRPYHSEWRMTTEDSCLLFCAQSASRCRSVVYDNVQHICHYFSDEGVDQAVISAKMTYLRVVTKSCLDENVDIAADPTIQIPPNAPPTLLTTSSNFNTNNEIQQPPHELSIPQPPIETSTMQQDVTTNVPETITFETATTTPSMFEEEDLLEGTTQPTETIPDIVEDDLDKELKQLMEPSQFQGSFNDEEQTVQNNGIYRDKTENEQRWVDDKMHQVEKKKTIDEKLEELKVEDPKKYEKLMGNEEENEEVETEKNNLKQNLRYGAKVIKFDEEAAFRKSTELRRKPMGDATRRPQLKQVTISSTSYIQKAKSFLDELKDNEEEGEEDEDLNRPEIIKAECGGDDVSVWIAFENSQQKDENMNNPMDGNVASRKDCQRLCQTKNCRSFTYFEKTNSCHLSSKSDGVSLKAPAEGDFTASSSTKFCYPSTFSVFDGCSNFVAFRDYSVKIEAAEEFDGLPQGYEGMQLCVELCVLSTRYTCRSSTFNPITGKCRLLAEDSLTSPDDFKFDEFQKYLYFENGCAATGSESAEVVDRNVEVVTTKPKKLKKRIRRVKRIRRLRH